MNKRMELHCQTRFSIGKSIIDPIRLPVAAAGKELAGIAITDLFSVDGWAETYDAMRYYADKQLKLIYGSVIRIRDDIHGSNGEGALDHYATVLVKNDIGRRNLFKILSMKALKYADQEMENGWIYLSDLNECREGLLIGWNCDNTYPRQDYDKEDIFDYYEIAPFSCHSLFPTEETGSKDMTEWVIEAAGKFGKPLIAVSAAKYLDREENTEWKMLRNDCHCNEKTDYMEQDVEAHLRSTEEMMELFSFLGKEKAKEIVIDNPKMLAEQIELSEPFENNRMYPFADGDSRKLSDISYTNARNLYGEILPQEVSARIEKELTRICGAGHEPIFLLMRELMEKTGMPDEPHGFRGCSDNSFVAYLCGITTWNPLKAHYRCAECRYSDFDTDALDAAIGYRLPEKNCPICGKKLIRDGFCLPYENFLGVDGAKEPDFELNVRPSAQRRVQDMTASLSGVKASFRAGTPGTVGRRRAEIMIDRYCSRFHLRLKEWEHEVYASELADCVGEYELHPGKMLIFPEGNGEITEHFPLRLQSNGVVAVGVDFYQIRDLLYSVTIAGVNLLEFLSELEKRTNCSLGDISLTDRLAVRDIPKDKDGCFLPKEMIGMPFMNQRFQEILSAREDIDFWDLVKTEGLMYGTGVWEDNAESLLRKGYSLDEVITAREDCFDYFCRHGIDDKIACRISEDVYKGRAGRDNWLDKWGQILKDHDIPEWYIDSCRKIRYLFSRGHCVTYAQLHWQLLYYKAHYPEEFEQCFFKK